MKVKWNVGWGVEERCNMNCEFCYSKEVRNSAASLKLNDYIKFVDNNSKYISSINYGTGENSLSEEWFMLVEYIGKNYPFIRQALTTNGYISQACKNSVKEKIFEKYIDEIDISLDFASSERHNRFRGNSNAYNMAIDTFKMCNTFSKRITLVFLGTNEVVHPDNLAGLFDIANKYNAYLRTNIYRPTRGINAQSKVFILSSLKLIEMLCWIAEDHRIIKVSDSLLAPVMFGNIAKDYSGLSSLRILGDGSITPSTYLINENYRKYNILDDNLHLNEIDFKDKIDADCIPLACKKCKFIAECKGGVYDRRILWYGTLKERDPYCPYRLEKFNIDTIKMKPDDNFNSIHDSYLPTIFFAY